MEKHFSLKKTFRKIFFTVQQLFRHTVTLSILYLKKSQSDETIVVQF